MMYGDEDRRDNPPRSVLFLETFYGGSHRDFADGYAQHSRHNVDLVTLPGERWRRRLRSGAFDLFLQVPDPSRYDVVVVTDLIDLPDLIALWRRETGCACPPTLLYMHETQSTYPVYGQGRSAVSRRKAADRLAALQDVKNALVADRVVFNSHAHRETFLATIAALEETDPEVVIAGAAQSITGHSGVVYPGVGLEPPGGADREREPGRERSGPPRILWNHRWEYDKQPGLFFRVLRKLADQGVGFELIVLGEAVRRFPAIERAREGLADRILQWGFAPDKAVYRRWLHEADIVVSTAIQENFGIAMVEAIHAGCIPVLPRRLAYPEVVPERYHGETLYRDDDELPVRLRDVLEGFPDFRKRCRGLAATMERFGWSRIAPQLDEEVAALSSGP